MSSEQLPIGIDLGTTNSSLAYCTGGSVKLFSIPQLVGAGRMGSSAVLPSFVYLAGEGEFAPGALRLPWAVEESLSFVGELACSQGEQVPSRLVASAKSWLCHAAARGEEKILPIEAADEESRLSPVAASSLFLRHIRDAWNHHHPSTPLEEQEVVLTVPASFDEVARRLTVEAAKLAGLEQLVLLEEPQAAFYSWMADRPAEKLPPGSLVLVCDVGGGTTDLSLIEIGSEGDFSRMAVGDHLLLGGDNLDTALCHWAEQRLGGALEPAGWLRLRHQARRCKELLLSGGERFLFLLEGGGSQLIGGSRSVEVTGDEVRQLLLDGFFGRFPLRAAAQRRRGGGLRRMGLPYEAEPSIVKQIAAFLEQAGARPTHLLFNGGSMRPLLFRQAILDNLNDWYGEVQPLSCDHLETAVCRGAAHFARLRRQGGERVRGGMARGYYLGVGGQALTLLPRGSEEGSRYRSERRFSLLANTPVTFQLYTSTTRLGDQAGDLVAVDPEQLLPMAPLATVLRFGKGERKIPVEIALELTAVGTLDLWLEACESDQRWKLEFGVRQPASLGIDEAYQPQLLEELAALLIARWRAGSDNPLRAVEERLEKGRASWSLTLLRSLGDALLAAAEERRASDKAEARWWHSIGFLLRPGSGSALDPFRLKQLWQIYLSEGRSSKERAVELQRLICFRRIAAGLSQGQQRQLAAQLENSESKKSREEEYLAQERLRTLASFERLQLPLKERLGDRLVAKIAAGKAEAVDYWALGRIGARQLLYGSLGHAVPRLVCARWVEQLLEKGSGDRLPSLLTQLARLVDQRELNLPPSLLAAVLRRYELRPVRELVAESRAEEEERLGDTLPCGLELHQ